MKTNCISCHNTGLKSGAINLDSYASVKAVAISGKLYSSVIWDGKTFAMPKNAVKINACSINQIRKWMENNYPL